MAGKVPPELLDQSLRALTPVLEKTDSRLIGMAFKGLDTVLSKMGIPLTTEAVMTAAGTASSAASTRGSSFWKRDSTRWPPTLVR
mgnify:CR=1 FL=1